MLALLLQFPGCRRNIFGRIDELCDGTARGSGIL